MNNKQYLILLGSTNAIRSIEGDVIDFVRGYVQSDVLKYSYNQFSFRNQVVIQSPVNGLEITGICKNEGVLIRGNAVVALLGGINRPKIVGMDLKLAEVAREEILIVSKLVHENG